MAGLQKHTVNGRRAALKIGIICFAIALIVWALSLTISDQALEELKHSLSVGSVIALVVMINLVSFGCFIVLFAVYQWVRRDFREPRDHEFDAG